MRSFHSDFTVSETTISGYLTLARIDVSHEEFRSIASAVSSIMRTVIERWCVMRSYDRLGNDLGKRAEWGFVDLAATRLGFEPEQFSEVGTFILDDITCWLASGDTIDGEWGHLELRGDDAIVASLKTPHQVRIAGFEPAREE